MSGLGLEKPNILIVVGVIIRNLLSSRKDLSGPFTCVTDDQVGFLEVFLQGVLVPVNVQSECLSVDLVGYHLSSTYLQEQPVVAQALEDLGAREEKKQRS